MENEDEVDCRRREGSWVSAVDGGYQASEMRREGSWVSAAVAGYQASEIRRETLLHRLQHLPRPNIDDQSRPSNDESRTICQSSPRKPPPFD